MIRVLVIDDEPQIVRALRVNLRARGYEVDAAPDATTGLTLAAKRPPDIVILDLGLPDMDGGEVIAGLRGWSTAPIIVLTGRTDLPQKIAALDAGADDYVTKPFDIEELFARMRAVARRAPATGEPAVEIGSWIVDLASHRIRPRDGVGPDQRLTPTEWRILEILVRHPGRLVTQRHLLAEVWGPAYQKETNYLRLYLAQLRRKLEPDPRHPRHLLTDPGMGYRYVPAADRVPGRPGEHEVKPPCWHDLPRPSTLGAPGCSWASFARRRPRRGVNLESQARSQSSARLPSGGGHCGGGHCGGGHCGGGHCGGGHIAPGTPAAGKAAMTDTVDSKEPSGAETMFGGFAPALVGYTDNVLFGDVWKRTELSPRDRSLVTVAALTAAGNTDQLVFHLQYAKDNGATETELIEAITHLAFYAGWPKAVSAMSVAKRVFRGN